MGKRRHSHSVDDDLLDGEMDVESVEDGEDSCESPRKKHKKSKHKKHKKSIDGHHGERRGDRHGDRHSERHSDRHGDRREHKKKKKEKKHKEQETEAAGSLRLKIKLGGHTVSTASINKTAIAQFTDEEEEDTASDDGGMYDLEETLERADAVAPKTREEDGDEEQKWLAALEAGELDDAGQLKKEIRKPLTARQRSLKQEQVGFQEELVELPMRRKEKEVTEEMLARRSEMARKRRLKQQKEQEEIKKQTVKKLITKQSKRKDDEKEIVAKRLAGPRVQYSSSGNGISLSYPEGFGFPLTVQPPRDAPRSKLCCANKCEHVKKFACSSNGLPVCSLQCYKAVKDLPAGSVPIRTV